MNNKAINLLIHRPCQKLAHRPQALSILVGSLVLAPFAIKSCNDCFSKEKFADNNLIQSKQIISADDTLFSWAKKQPSFSMTEFKPESMAWVHMTEYYPENARIMSARLATKKETGVGAGFSTIHGAINKSVTEHSVGNNWQTMPYAVIAPFSKLLDNIPNSRILGGIQDDFFFQDNIDLPEGSVVLKYNSEIDEDCFAVTEIKKGIKLVETSNKNMGEVANKVIKKMGYEVYSDSLRDYLKLSEKEAEVLFSLPESEMLDVFDSIDNFGGTEKYKKIITENIKGLDEFRDVIPKEEIASAKANYERNLVICDLKEKYQEKMKEFPNVFENFCKEKGYHAGLHCFSSWAKCDFAMVCTEMLAKQNNNSWGTNNYKEDILKIIKEARENVPEGKSLGFDVNKMYEIINTSKTPQEALDVIKKELKISPAKNSHKKIMEEIPDYAKDFTFEIIFGMFGLR